MNERQFCKVGEALINGSQFDFGTFKKDLNIGDKFSVFDHSRSEHFNIEDIYMRAYPVQDEVGFFTEYKTWYKGSFCKEPENIAEMLKGLFHSGPVVATWINLNEDQNLQRFIKDSQKGRLPRYLASGVSSNYNGWQLVVQHHTSSQTLHKLGLDGADLVKDNRRQEINRARWNARLTYTFPPNQ